MTVTGRSLWHALGCIILHLSEGCFVEDSSNATVQVMVTVKFMVMLFELEKGTTLHPFHAGIGRKLRRLGVLRSALPCLILRGLAITNDP